MGDALPEQLGHHCPNANGRIWCILFITWGIRSPAHLIVCGAHKQAGARNQASVGSVFLAAGNPRTPKSDARAARPLF